ncbi:hypothetical protein LP420_26625 [Massilia sp. B-10]|nr:hypothetical protein LP420_26625 [Massilia sp. B-10]UUZ52692.1 hypothetical protein LP419_26075 [Massilia sp. H-1]
MLVYISVNNADHALSGGMFAKGQLTTSKSAVRPLVPVAALRKDKEADVVYKIEDGKVVSQPVKLGMRNEDEGMVEVTEGLVMAPAWCSASSTASNRARKCAWLARPWHRSQTSRWSPRKAKPCGSLKPVSRIRSSPPW